MTETAIALVLAWLVGEFPLQPGWLAARKRRQPLATLAHVSVVTALTWVALGFAPAWSLLAFVALTHLIIDAARVIRGQPGFLTFAAEHAAYLTALAAAAVLFPDAWATGIWPGLAPWLPQTMVTVAGVVAAVWAGAAAVAALMSGLPQPENDASLPSGGRTIGRLERIMILMLVLAGQPDAIGFLIAAKSILRFGELSGADRHVSEYVIIGTLASFAWAIATAYATRAGLDALTAAP